MLLRFRVISLHKNGKLLRWLNKAVLVSAAVLWIQIVFFPDPVPEKDPVKDFLCSYNLDGNSVRFSVSRYPSLRLDRDPDHERHPDPLLIQIKILAR